MRCKSCETEINPKWRHAIEQNICPNCGDLLMDEHLKNCIAALSTAMENMIKYPEQLDDWLLSNHNYIKTNSPNLVNYLPEDVMQQLFKKPIVEKKEGSPEEPKTSVIKIKMPGGGTQDVLVEKTQSEEKTNSFFERAEVLKGAGKTSGKAPKAPENPDAPKSVAEKTQNLKKLAQQIKTEVSQGINNESGLAVMMRPEMIDQADPDEVAELQAAIFSGDMVSSGLPPVSDGEEDTIPSVVQNMANRAISKNAGGSSDKDMKTWQDLQNKVANASKRLGTGGFGRA